MKGTQKKNVVLESCEFMQQIRAKHSEVLVSFSGGKDSMIVLDLCAKHDFHRIVCFHFYFVPGLKVVEDQLDYARQRYKVEILSYPDPATFAYLHNGDFCDAPASLDKIQPLSAPELHELAREETGIKAIVTGHKRSDAMGQGLSNAGWANKQANLYQPIIGWNKLHVLHYLKANDIPLPPSDGRNSSSMDLHPKNLLWLWDNHRDDFRKIQKVFPYIEACVLRREWYGVEP